MQRHKQRSIDELLDAYHNYLLSNVSSVHILGEAGERELKEVFVELSIVEQRTLQQHTEFLGMMDSAMRKRFNPFADEDIDGVSEPGEEESKHRVKPDDLLRRRTKAIVTGPPGCGKTTLLKYLALQAQEKQKRLAVWLELKAVDKPLFVEAEKVAAHGGSLILQELWLKHLKTQLSLSDADINLLRQHWQEKFKAHEIVVLLDGFDELQDEAIERSLTKCVREFASAAHDNTLLISTRPYAQHKLGKERLQELEIEPLNQRQIESFLNCYYPHDAAIKSLLKNLREQSALRELLHVPLLLGVILRLHRENRFTGDRRKIYETIIADFVHELDRSKSVIRQFEIKDERLRLDFLKFLAFERLLGDPFDDEKQGASRIVFSYDLLKEKARVFLTQEGSSHHARELADDVLATPLLREVGADIFAFTHLTLQEYLAARACAAFHQSSEFAGLTIFCRAYHNPTIGEMEVLPMMLGATTDADDLYAEVERWPESLTFASLRLRARGLAYSAKIKQERLSKLIDRLLEFILKKFPDETPYREIVINSFAGMSRQTISLIEAKTASFIKPDAPEFFNAAPALGRIGSEKAVDALISALSHQDQIWRMRVARALGQISSDKAVQALIFTLNTDESRLVRSTAIEALIKIGSDEIVDVLITALSFNITEVFHRAVWALARVGSDKAVDAIISTLNEESFVQPSAVYALAEVGSEKAVDALIFALNHQDSEVRSAAAEALGRTGSRKAIEPLVNALNHQDSKVSRRAVGALGQLGSDRATAALIQALNHQDAEVRVGTVYALGKIGSAEAADALIRALNDENEVVRRVAVYELGEIGSDKAIEALISALNHQEDEVRLRADEELARTGSRKAMQALISAFNNEQGDKYWNAVFALGQIGYDKAVDALISVLNYEDYFFRMRVVHALCDSGSDKAVNALLPLLNDEDPLLRFSVAQALARAGRDEAADALISVLDYLVESTSWSIVDTLEKLGSEKAVDALIFAMNYQDYHLSLYAVYALGEIGSDKAVEALISALNQTELRHGAAKALAQIKGETLFSGLARTIKGRDVWARQKAVAFIGYYSDARQTLDQLKQLAHTDEDNNVRELAEEAAKKFARKLELSGRLIAEGAAQPLSDNESRELFLLGEAFRTVAEAGHIFRPTPNSDWGIDGEIEFKNERGEASGQRVYLQLKSGDSYLRTRRTDGKEIFTLKNPRHAQYWQSNAYPVLLVIRDSSGQIRWMNVTEYLQRQGTNIKQIEFRGEPFTAESVKQMRARFAK